MLQKTRQLEMTFSKHNELYDILIKKDNMWREIKEKINFEFIYEELKKNYSEKMGRTAIDVEKMFKYLLLKAFYKISDRELIRRTMCDLEFKYFLGYEPEEVKFIDSSTLTKFRRLRIKTEDTAENLLDKLLKITVELAIKEGITEKKVKIILDSTHTGAMYGKLTPREELIRQAKELRKVIYKLDETYKEKMPDKKKTTTGVLEDTIEYVNELLEEVNKIEYARENAGISEKIEYLRETKQDIEISLKEIKEDVRTIYSKDKDAKIGHKTADTSFFGYKTHIAMTTERIITGAVFTSGEQNDGEQMQELIKKTEETGLEVEMAIGDGAYSSAENLKACKEKNIKVVSKLNKMIIEGHNAQKDYTYNKDADMYVCKAGHMAIRKGKDKKGSKNRDTMTYYFDVEKCKICPFREGCYKNGAKKKSMTVTIKKEEHLQQMEYMKTKEFVENYKERYKIEAKNNEIKNIGDMKTANGCGKTSMTIQGATTLFLTNIKRIRKIKQEKNKKTIKK